MSNKTGVRYRSSLMTDYKILKILAVEGEYAQYDLDKRIERGYRTVLRRLKALTKDGLIRVVRTEKSKKGGMKKKILSLTETGLLFALANKDVWPNIDQVANNYQNVLPLIFGEWQFFLNNGLRNEVINRIQAAVEDFFVTFGREWYKIVRIESGGKESSVELQRMTKEKAARVKMLLRDIAPTFTNKILGLDSSLFIDEVSEQLRFISKLIENPNLREYLDDEFQFWVEKTRRESELASNALKWYQEIKLTIE